MTQSWSKLEDSVVKGPWSAFRAIGCLIVPMVLILISGLFVFGVFNQGARIINKTIDADNVIYNYEWFKQRHQDVIAIDSKIKTAEFVVSNFEALAGDHKDWHREDRIEHSRLSSITLGLKQQKDDLISEYNARSEMVNRSIFKEGVPSKL